MCVGGWVPSKAIASRSGWRTGISMDQQHSSSLPPRMSIICFVSYFTREMTQSDETGSTMFSSVTEKSTRGVSAASQPSGRSIFAKSTATPTNTGAGEERTMTCEKGEDVMPTLCGSFYSPQ